MEFLEIIIGLIILLFSIILHELAHGYTAYALGDDTAKIMGRLSLNPLEHIDPYMSVILPLCLIAVGAPAFGGAKPVPIARGKLKWREWGMALVALAGPLMNFLISLACFLVAFWCGCIIVQDGNIYVGNCGEIMQYIISTVIMTNISLMIFNLIPIPPLDGSRILYAIAPDYARGIMDKIEAFGIIIIYVCVFAFGGLLSFYFSGFSDAVFNFFIWLIGA